MQQVLAIQEQQLGSDHPDVAKTLNNLGKLYLGQHRQAEATPLFQRAQSISERTVGPNHLQTQVVRTNVQLASLVAGISQEIAGLQQQLTELQGAQTPIPPEVIALAQSAGLGMPGVSIAEAREPRARPGKWAGGSFLPLCPC